MFSVQIFLVHARNDKQILQVNDLSLEGVTGQGHHVSNQK